MNRHYRLRASLVVLGIAMLASCSEQDVDPRVVGMFGGKKATETLSKPARVEAYRIEERQTTDKTVKAIGSYPVISGPVEVDADAAEKLRRVLLDAGSYQWETAKGCKFQPGVVVRFAGKQTVDVLFCFSCDEIVVLVDAKRVGGEDIDNVRGQLLAIVKKLFPEDKAIQQLAG